MTTERRCYHCDKPTTNELVCDACKPEAKHEVLTVSYYDMTPPDMAAARDRILAELALGTTRPGDTVVVEPYHKEDIDPALTAYWASQGRPLKADPPPIPKTEHTWHIAPSVGDVWRHKGVDDQFTVTHVDKDNVFYRYGAHANGSSPLEAFCKNCEPVSLGVHMRRNPTE